MAAVAPPRGIMLSYKPSDPVALKAAEPRRATAQLVSGLTRGSPTRGASPPLRVHSGIRVSPGGLARPRLAQPQRATTSACGSTVSTFTTASEREAATATSTTSFSPSASTASSSASSFTRTASDTASSYDSDEDYKKEEQGEDDLPLLGVSFIGNRGVFVAAGEGSAAPLRWSGMGADRAAEEDGDNNAAA
ncbi:hypothetical protein PLESTM_000724100 [Pleodorina starrii]|nr:hypothetical protein PLESTM_000724100 [Pleodorina starrii]